MLTVFGFGSAGRLGELAVAKLGPRVLVVTDTGVMAAGLVEPALAALAAAGIEAAVFADVVADPPEAVVRAAEITRERADGATADAATTADAANAADAGTPA